MFYQYPLEVLARRRGTRSQLEFAHAARAALVPDEDVMAVPMARGLVLFGLNEEALAGPMKALAEIYGDELELRGPRVRMLPGKPPLQPIMHVRVATHRSTMSQVLQELRSRRARILEECVRDRLAVIRANAPLSLLVGLPAVLDGITSGDARCVIRLHRYEPLGNAFG